MVTSAAAAMRTPAPAASRPAPVAASTCRRFSASNLIVMTSSRFVRSAGLLFLLHPEFADCSLNVAHRLCDDLPQSIRRRGFRQRPTFLDQVAVIGGCHDRHDLAIEPVQDRLRRALGGAYAKKAVTHVVEALFLQ